MKRHNLSRMALAYGFTGALVASVILAGTGWVPAASARPDLPTGLDVPASRAAGPNVLKDADFSHGNGVATGWLEEHSTAASPSYDRSGNTQEIIYRGTAGDTGLKRKIEVFQAEWSGVKPGQRWRLSMDVRGRLDKTYPIVGMEWFSVFKHTADGVTAYGYHYLAEADVYPPVNADWERVTVISPPLPAQARCVAVYLQIPEIGSRTDINAQIRSASLVLVRLSHVPRDLHPRKQELELVPGWV